MSFILVRRWRDVVGVLVLGLYAYFFLVPAVESQPHRQPLTIAAMVLVVLLAAVVYVRGTLRIALIAAIPVVVAVALAFTWQEEYLRRFATDRAAAIGEAGDALVAHFREETMPESRRDTSGQVSFGIQLAPGDSRVPKLFRSLGAQRLWLDDKRVSVSFGKRGELQISRELNPRTYEPTMWYRVGKGGRQPRLSSRLWLFDD